LKPGQRFLDLCSAPGGKCFHAAETLGSTRGIVAADRQFERLRTMRRLATPPADRGLDMVALDAERPLPFRALFDRILVDAPCTGTGTLARNPDIKWRISPEDISRLASRQGAILDRALDLLAPAGMLVYSTCSIEPEENELAVKAILEKRTEFRAGAYFQRMPGREPGDGFFAQQIVRK
jgi:16S rRNA (cytosine967-C5)-methyltransferase